MKNKKIIVITAFAVALMVAGIYGMSHTLESSWLETESKESSLETSDVGYNISDLGEFKYLTAEEYLETLTDEDAIMAFKSDLVPLDDKMISYDEAAVIGGTSLEKLLPTIDFRGMEFHIAPKRWKLPYCMEEKVFFQGVMSKSNSADHPIHPSRSLEHYVYFIDAYTGELVNIEVFYAETDTRKDMNTEQALDYAQELARQLGYGYYQKYYIEEADYGTDGKNFGVTFLIDETKALGFNFNTFDDRLIMAVSEKGTEPYNLVEKYGI